MRLLRGFSQLPNGHLFKLCELIGSNAFVSQTFSRSYGGNFAFCWIREEGYWVFICEELACFCNTVLQEIVSKKSQSGNLKNVAPRNDNIGYGIPFQIKRFFYFFCTPLHFLFFGGRWARWLGEVAVFVQVNFGNFFCIFLETCWRFIFSNALAGWKRLFERFLHS